MDVLSSPFPRFSTRPALYSCNRLSDDCADESGSSERNRQEREEDETTKTEVLSDAHVVRDNQDRDENNDIGE
jgi:hypothetical protein